MIILWLVTRDQILKACHQRKLWRFWETNHKLVTNWSQNVTIYSSEPFWLLNYHGWPNIIFQRHRKFPNDLWVGYLCARNRSVWIGQRISKFWWSWIRTADPVRYEIWNVFRTKVLTKVLFPTLKSNKNLRGLKPWSRTRMKLAQLTPDRPALVTEPDRSEREVFSRTDDQS